MVEPALMIDLGLFNVPLCNHIETEFQQIARVSGHRIIITATPLSLVSCQLENFEMT